MAELSNMDFSPQIVIGTEAGSKSCKLPSEEDTGTSSHIPSCPRCKTSNVWRNGHRNSLFGKPIQRWICRDCSSRFSDPEDVERAKKELEEELLIESKKLKRDVPLSYNCQICDEETSNISVNLAKGTKNLVTELINGNLVVPQKEAYDLKDQRGAVVNFIFYLKQQNRALITQIGYGYNLDFLITHGANLFDPLSVKDILASKLIDEKTNKDKTNARKYNLLKAYRSFAAAYGIDIAFAKFPKYKPNRKLPYLPPEDHMNQLIASCSYEMAAFLQTLKETGARPVEAMRILWEEIDFIQRKIAINHPAKDNNPRVLDMSEKLYNMLKKLEHHNERVFRYKNEYVAGKTFRVMRQKAIIKTGIPELRKIHFYTFRYWRGTVEFQETGQEASVMILLGHTSTRYLWLYIQLSKIYFGGTPKFTHIWVNTREEEGKAFDDGYQYIRTDSTDGARLYGKKIVGSAAKLIGHD